mgnify:FL=1
MQYTLKEWQLMYEACPIPTRYNVAGGDFLCTRIENTQFECARKFGSCAFYGLRYTYVVAKPGDGIDGGEMIVRNDFLKWVKKTGHALVEAKRRESAPVQTELF